MDYIEELLKSLDLSSIPNIVLWMLFLYWVVIRDLNRRLNGASAYVRKALVLQRRNVASREKLTDALAELTKAANSGLFQKIGRRKGDKPPTK